ncbi:MAG TPA: MlaD family protein [Candidatus Didemnitutus sp.]|jgi:phospholipid/cholesterol/gamma-HCH transport system substrate-binding protein
MNNKSQTVRVGLFFLLGLALAWITLESLNGGRIFRPKGYTLLAGFADVKGLKVGDEVRMAGVKIGSVSNTRLAAHRVEAVLTIDADVPIPTDAVASVEQASLLGSNYLAVTFGTPGGPLLKDQDEIKTKPTIDLGEVIAQIGAVGNKIEGMLDSVGKSFGTGENGNLFTRLDKLMSENGPKLTETISNLQDITAKIRNGDGTIGRLVNDPKLHDDLVTTVGEIKLAADDARSFMNDAKGIVGDVKSGKGTLGVLLYDQATANNLKVTVGNVRAMSDKIARGEGTLGKLISDDGLYNNAQSTLKKADRALDSLDDTGPITAVGVVAKSLF